MTTTALRVRVPAFPWAGVFALGLVAAAIIFLAYQLDIVVAGGVYALLFLVLAFTRPEFALLLIFASAPFQNDLSIGGPVRFSIAEVNLALTLPVAIAQAIFARRRLVVGPIFFPIMIYFAVCLAASVLARKVDKDTVVSMAQMFLYLIATVCVFSSLVRNPHLLLIPLYGAVIVGVVMSILGLATNFEIFGLHKNGWGGSLATELIVAIELWFAADTKLRKRALLLCIVILTAALMFCVSRGGWLAAIAGLLTLAALRQQYKLMFRSALILLPVVIICWRLMPEETREYATGFELERANISARMQSFELAKTYIMQSPLYGAGVGLRKEFDATNIILTTLAETGVLGLIAFMIIHIVFLRMAWITQKRFARSNPLFPLVAIGAALVVARLAHGMVDHYWSRGAITPTWAAAGMATAMYYMSRTRRGAALVAARA